jgi:hypothetical protein
MQTHAIRPLVLMPPGVLDKKKLCEMKDAGYLVIEIADIASLRVVTPPPMVPLDALGAIALEVLGDSEVHDFKTRDAFKERVLAAALDAANGVDSAAPLRRERDDARAELEAARKELAALKRTHEHAMQSLMLEDDEMRKELFELKQKRDDAAKGGR